MNTIKLQQRGLLTLPKKLRDSLSLKEGQILNITEMEGKIILEPQTLTTDTRLMNDIKQGIEDIKNGNFIEFGTIGELHKKLKKYENKVD